MKSVKIRKANGAADEYFPMPCVVEDRDDITGEPSSLRPLRHDETVDLTKENQFVIVLAPKIEFRATLGKH